MPPKPDHLRCEVKARDSEFAAGTAVLSEVEIICELDGNEYPIHIIEMRPKREGRCPTFIYLTSESFYPGKYLPTEELAERGYAVLTVRAADVSADNGDFKGPLARALGINRRRGDGTGKLMLWAWALSRVNEYAMALEWVDTERIAVIGHADIGTAALLAGAFDERLPIVISSGTGIYGDTLGTAEARLMYKEMLPHRFCPRSIGRTESFDESLLLGLIYPRLLIVGGATRDRLADPEKQMRAIIGACGARGINAFAISGEDEPYERSFGRIHHHVRCGSRYLSRRDWSSYMDILDKYK